MGNMNKIKFLFGVILVCQQILQISIVEKKNGKNVTQKYTVHKNISVLIAISILLCSPPPVYVSISIMWK